MLFLKNHLKVTFKGRNASFVQLEANRKPHFLQDPVQDKRMTSDRYLERYFQQGLNKNNENSYRRLEYSGQQVVPTSLRQFNVNKFKINVYQRRENLCHTIYSLFMEFMSYYFCHVSHNLGCTAGRLFFFTALKRHTRVVETSGVDARDQRRKRAPFAKVWNGKELLFAF